MVRRGRGRSGCASQARSRLAISKSFKKTTQIMYYKKSLSTTPQHQKVNKKPHRKANKKPHRAVAYAMHYVAVHAAKIHEQFKVLEMRREEEKEEAEEETPWRKMFLLEIDLCLACLTRPHFNLGDTPVWQEIEGNG